MEGESPPQPESHRPEEPKWIPEPTPEDLIDIPDFPGYIETELHALAEKFGLETEKKRPDTPAENILLDRLLYILGEESYLWQRPSVDKLRNIIAAYGAVAFPGFSWAQQHAFRDIFAENYFDETGTVKLTEEEVAALSRVTARIGLEFDHKQTTFTLPPPEKTIQRISDVDIPEVTQILKKAPPDPQEKARFLFGHTGKLTLKQNIKMLLELTDDEFAAFIEVQQEAAASAAEDILQDPTIIPGRVERIKARSRLTYGTPLYIVDAQLRRRELMWGHQYPASWDEELELHSDPRFHPDDDLPRHKYGKPLSYEEAVEFAKLLHAHKFFRRLDVYFPDVVYDDPSQITPISFNKALHAYRADLPDTPGSEVSIGDVVAVLDFLDEFPNESDRWDNKVHQQVRKSAEFILSFEDKPK